MRSLKKIIFLSVIFTVSVAFNFQDNPAGNWTQQFLPNIGSRQITDMTFKDSLTGYLVAYVTSDTSYILKTTNGGDNWNIVFRNFFKTTNMQFFNKDTGYVWGSYIFKTVNGGLNWVQVNNSGISVEQMHVLNQDTMWFVNSNSLNGGIFRTTNGGANWTNQLSAGTNNPNIIYFYNRNLGFAGNQGLGKHYRTTNAGQTWDSIGYRGFTDIQFINNLTGWICDDRPDSSMQKTTDGGLTWKRQRLPKENSQVLVSLILRFSVLNKDSLWGVGALYHFGNGTIRGMLFKTTNGGENWGYQIPDSSININVRYNFIDFADKNHGWAYTAIKGGIHTTKGGDTTTIYTGINQISSEVPNNFKLSQNYPNPFNPSTKINYELRIANYVTLKVYSLQGKEVAVLVNQRQSAGIFQADFNAAEYSLSSGIYFYTLTTEDFHDTKKMILVK